MGIFLQTLAPHARAGVKNGLGHNIDETVFV